MELALRRLQNLSRLNPKLTLHSTQHKLKVPWIRLVTANILRGKDHIKRYTLQAAGIGLGE